MELQQTEAGKESQMEIEPLPIRAGLSIGLVSGVISQFQCAELIGCSQPGAEGGLEQKPPHFLFFMYCLLAHHMLLAALRAVFVVDLNDNQSPLCSYTGNLTPPVEYSVSHLLP